MWSRRSTPSASNFQSRKTHSESEPVLGHTRLNFAPSLINSAANLPEHRSWELQESQNDLTRRPPATMCRSAIRWRPWPSQANPAPERESLGSSPGVELMWLNRAAGGAPKALPVGGAPKGLPVRLARGARPFRLSHQYPVALNPSSLLL